MGKIYKWIDQLRIFVKNLHSGWVDWGMNRSKSICSNIAPLVRRLLELPRRRSEVDQGNRRIGCRFFLNGIFWWKFFVLIILHFWFNLWLLAFFIYESILQALSKFFKDQKSFINLLTIIEFSRYKSLSYSILLLYLFLNKRKCSFSIFLTGF